MATGRTNIGGGSNIKSVQRGIESVFLSSNVTISPINLNSSIAILSVRPGTSGNSTAVFGKIEITSSTNINISKIATGNHSFYWQVIEFNNVKSLQKIDATFSASSSTHTQNFAINTINLDKSFLYFTFSKGSAADTSGRNFQVAGEITSPTNLELLKAASTSTPEFRIHAQIIEFN